VCAESSDGFPTYPYRNIACTPIGRIESSDLRPGARVPSERELAAEYGISRTIASATLNLLGQRGPIERKDRSGTFVAFPKIRLDLSTIAGLSTRLLR
jgi:GntR family transcriptional regulator